MLGDTVLGGQAGREHLVCALWAGGCSRAGFSLNRKASRAGAGLRVVPAGAAGMQVLARPPRNPCGTSAEEV